MVNLDLRTNFPNLRTLYLCIERNFIWSAYRDTIVAQMSLLEKHSFAIGAASTQLLHSTKKALLRHFFFLAFPYIESVNFGNLIDGKCTCWKNSAPNINIGNLKDL